MLAFKEQLSEPRRAISNANVCRSAGILEPLRSTLLLSMMLIIQMEVFSPGGHESVLGVSLFHRAGCSNRKWTLHS